MTIQSIQTAAGIIFDYALKKKVRDFSVPSQYVTNQTLTI
jgi:hypothetical protein